MTVRLLRPDVRVALDVGKSPCCAYRSWSVRTRLSLSCVLSKVSIKICSYLRTKRENA